MDYAHVEALLYVQKYTLYLHTVATKAETNMYIELIVGICLLIFTYLFSR